METSPGEEDTPAAALLRLLQGGSAVLSAVVGADGCIERANPALTRACGRELTGLSLRSLLTSASHEALCAQVEADSEDALLLQFVPERAESFSMRVFTARRSEGYELVGEPPWDDHRALEARLQSLNTELAELSRERARKARQLAQALAELRDSNWQLTKIAEVLPMCVQCRAVRTGPSTWEDVADFLVRNSDFLSHGYCARCASELSAGLGGGRGET